MKLSLRVGVVVRVLVGSTTAVIAGAVVVALNLVSVQEPSGGEGNEHAWLLLPEDEWEYWLP